jgi:uncharacterized membrane protein YphA (DoxX/SURF4 family)
MEILIKAARISYGVMIIGLAVQQIFYVDFRNVILPPSFSSIPAHAFFVYFLSAILIAAGIAIVFNIQARIISLLLGGLFFLLIIFGQIPYEIFVDPYANHFGTWTQALKELVFCGGAFVVAGSFLAKKENDKKENVFVGLLEKFIPFGGIFMCITMISFGIDHFLYTDGVAGLVPNWIPWHIFWTYFAAVALIGSGITIILKIQLTLSAILLALMLFLWVIVLHIPRAIADPYSLQGNEVSSVFEAFGFSGIAYLIAWGYNNKHTAQTDVP